MYGIPNAVIRERKWLEGGSDTIVSEETFWGVMQYAERLHARVHEWHGKSRDDKPLSVVWWAGQRAGQLYALYEISKEGE